MGDTLLTFENQFAHAWKFFWKSLINWKLVQLFSGHWVVKKNQNFPNIILCLPSTALRSVPDAELQLQKFGHVQKTKLQDSYPLN